MIDLFHNYVIVKVAFCPLFPPHHKGSGHMKFHWKVVCGVVGVVFILASVYQGLALGGVFPRLSISEHLEFIACVMPTVLALAGALCLFQACKSE
jgi:hypothetical protein